MPSINLELSYFDNVKTMRLVARLGKHAELLPIRLWVWIGAHQPHKQELELSEAEIELVCKWDGDRGGMVKAMIESGFIEKHGELYRAKNWLQNSGHLAIFRKRAEKAAKARWAIVDGEDATSNASSIPKHASSNALAVQCSSSSSKLTKQPTAILREPLAYRKPEAKTNPTGYLVMAYKLAKGYPFDDKVFDKKWSRWAKSAKQLLDDCGSVESAERFILKFADLRKDGKLSWTLETVADKAHELKVTRRNHGTDAHGHSERVFSENFVARTEGRSPEGGGFISSNKILDSFGHKKTS